MNLYSLKQKIQKWQHNLMEDYAAGNHIRFNADKRGQKDETEILKFRSLYPHNDIQKRSFDEIPIIKGVAVGIDIREYSKRVDMDQFVISTTLYANIRRAILILKNGGLPEIDEKILMIPTGDGAYVIFPDLDAVDTERNSGKENTMPSDSRLKRLIETALSFIFILNIIITEDNYRKVFQKDSKNEKKNGEIDIFPLYTRYALNMGKLLFLLDSNGNLNCAGNALISCSRILSVDHGNHFLIETELLHRINELFSGIQNIGFNMLGTWSQLLHFSEIPEHKVKSGNFRFADVFGYYYDTPLLKILNKHSLEPTRYNIGSHDVWQLYK